MRQQVHTERQQLDGRDRKNPVLSHGSRQPPAQNENRARGPAGAVGAKVSLSSGAPVFHSPTYRLEKESPFFNSQGSPNRASRCVAAGEALSRQRASVD